MHAYNLALMDFFIVQKMRKNGWKYSLTYYHWAFNISYTKKSNYPLHIVHQVIVHLLYAENPLIFDITIDSYCIGCPHNFTQTQECKY